ncbi:MAG: DUF2207 domain-containing protein, partial [Erysipelotrichales bacterium]
KANKLLKLLFIIVAIYFINVKNINAVDYDTVERYHINIKVNEDGSIQVNNKMDLRFATPKHGMYAAVPIKYKTNGEDLPKVIRTPIDSVEVKDRTYKVEYENDYAFIKIGDGDKYIEGLQNFEYSYRLKFRDLKTTHQYLYYNVIGNKWEYDMNNITFKIEMPKEIKGNPKFITDNNNNKIKYEIKDKTIIGKYDGRLEAGNGITIFYDLGENYFLYPQGRYNAIAAIFSIVSLIIIAIVYFVFGKSSKLITPIQFKPPKDFSPAMVGYVADEIFDKEDSSALFVYWASKGYMKIEEISDESFEFTKLKDIDQNEMEIEKSYFNKLFGNKETVLSNELSLEFVELTYSMSKDYGDHFTKDKELYNKGTRRLKRFLVIMLTIAFVMTSEFFVSDMFDVNYISAGMIIGLFFLLMMVWLGVDRTVKKRKLITNFKMKANLILYLGLLMIPLTVLYYYILDTELYLPIVMSIAYFINMYLISNIKKRTAYGDKILGEVYGFRDFIEKAELERIEMFVKENPVFFYDILPYAYTLGLSDTWIVKFENIEIPQVDWYYSSTGAMDFIYFSHITRTLNTMSQAASYHPDFKSSDSSFGGFSGGGSVGGGFGGGGGGSW